MDRKLMIQCVHAAKNRVMEKLEVFLDDNMLSYSELVEPGSESAASFKQMISLLAMPDDQIGTLRAMKPGFWIGKDDPFWAEIGIEPPDNC